MSNLNKPPVSPEELAAAAAMQRTLHGGAEGKSEEALAAHAAFTEMTTR